MSRRSLDEELTVLEARVSELAGLGARLSLENRALRERLDALAEERLRLVEKNETARGKVEQMILRLKALEAGQ